MKVLAAACFALATWLSGSPADAAQTDWQARLDRQAASARAPGMAAAVVSGGRVRWIGVYGYADLERRRLVTRRTLFQVGSVTKNMTATLMMSLADDGVIRLDDPVSRYLPVSGPVGAITLRQLASHTSGLPRNPPNRVDVDGVMRAYSAAELMQALAVTTPTPTPVAEPAYSNYGYLLLGHILERATGRPYEALLRERILAPLGMRNTHITIPASGEARIAVHYWPADTPFRPRPRWRFGEIAGAAGVTTTIDDLARYLTFQIRAEGRARVSRSAMLLQRQPVATALDGSAAFGLGWTIWNDDDGSLRISHSGEVDGHSAFIGFAPDSGIGVVVLANLGGQAALDVGEELLRQAVTESRRLPTAP